MRQLCFVTCRTWPEISESDRLVQRALEARGATVEARAWNDPDASWNGFDAIVLRSNWDYHFEPDAFLGWLDRLERAGALIFNPPALVRWNLTKAYLLELARAGVDFTAREFTHEGDQGYGRAAAAALGVEPARVFKTLVAMADGRPVVAVVPVDRQLSLKSLAAAVAAKRAEIAEPADAERLTGAGLPEPALAVPMTPGKRVEDLPFRAQARHAAAMLGEEGRVALAAEVAALARELAGHQEMSVTQGYMHLSPDMLGSSIRLLESRPNVHGRGDIVETGSAQKLSRME